MSERRGELSHFAEAADVEQLRLEFLDSAMFSVELRQVAHEADEVAGLADKSFADEERGGKGRAVFVSAFDHTSFAEDPPFMCCHVSSDVSVVLLTEVRWHQYFDVLSNKRDFGIPEQPFGGWIGGADFAGDIDGYDRIRRVVDDRAQQSSALVWIGSYQICSLFQ
jgi:hypothetical protein